MNGSIINQWMNMGSLCGKAFLQTLWKEDQSGHDVGAFLEAESDQWWSQNSSSLRVRNCKIVQ